MTTGPRPTDLAAPALLGLAGHPLRWRLLAELAGSDRSVHELTGRVGEAQNLVSYHLGRLRKARLVSSRQSAADRRDTYYGLDLARFGALLAAAGEALHPGIRLGPVLEDRTLAAPARVLFLCTGASARSPMAAALARLHSDGAIQASCAGSHPRSIHPNAVRVLREAHGLDLSGHEPVHMETFVDQPFDAVITLCDRVREVCPEPAGQPDIIHWSLPNPATGEPDDVTYPLFQQTAAELSNRIGYLIARLAARPSIPRP